MALFARLSCATFGDASLERADLVEAATERRLLVSASLSLPLVVGLDSDSEGTLLGGTCVDSNDGVDEVPDEAESRSGVDMVGLSVARAEMVGVDMGVGALLYTSDAWKVLGFE